MSDETFARLLMSLGLIVIVAAVLYVTHSLATLP